jgi:hypothetical protein
MQAQGVSSSKHIAFKCVVCGTVQSVASLMRAAPPGCIAPEGCVTEEGARKLLGFSCEGRLSNAGPWDPKDKQRRAIRGCNWTLGGLFAVHKLEVVTPDGETHKSFTLASPEEAQALELAHAQCNVCGGGSCIMYFAKKPTCQTCFDRMRTRVNVAREAMETDKSTIQAGLDLHSAMQRVTPEDLDNLKHMLGIGSHIPKRQWGSRNSFSCGEDDLPSLRRLEAAGFVQHLNSCLVETTGAPYFVATLAGMEWAGLSKAAIKRLTGDKP